MPLVQFSLAELWKHRDRETKSITRRGLQALGGISGALERHADATLRPVVAEHGEESVRHVVLELTTPQGTRRTRTLEEMGDRAALPIVRALEVARLVVVGGEGVTFAHDVLLEYWETLRRWVSDAREDRLLATQLDRDAKRWRVDPDAVALWTPRQVAVAWRLVESKAPLSNDAEQFLRASRSALRRRRTVAAGLGAVALVATVGVAVSYVDAIRTQEQATQAALDQETVARETAEERTREVQEAQAKITELLAQIADSPTKQTIESLQSQIERAEARSARPETRPSRPIPAADPPPGPSRRATLKVRETW
jgi:hypothetical protein